MRESTQIGWQRWMWILLLGAASLPYINSLDNSFHDDDEHSIVRNHHLRQLSRIPSFFADSATFSGEPGKGMYRPLVQASFALNYAIDGYRTRGYHLVNIGLHALTCIGLWFLLGALRVPGAVVICLLYAMHPIHSQAINYLSSRSELMAGCAVIWSAWAAVTGRVWLSCIALAAALLSKSVGIQLLPLVVLLNLRGCIPGRWRAVAPLVLVGCGYVVLIVVDGFLQTSLEQQVRPVSMQWATQLQVITQYLHLLIMPVALSIEHGIHAGYTSDIVVLSCTALLLSVLGLSVAALAKPGMQWVGVGCLWFFIGLSVTSLIPLTVTSSEQRLYLSTAGFLVAFLPILLCRAADRSAWLPVFGGGVLTMVAIIFMCLVVARNKLWENELTIWSDAVVKAPGVSRVWSNQALALHQAGQRLLAQGAYEKALAIEPDAPRTRANYGIWLEEEGRISEAEAAYLRSARHAWSGARIQLARLYLDQGMMTRARAQLDTAESLNDADPDLHLYNGRWHQVAGDNDRARSSFERALEIDPQNAAAANNLGSLLLEMGDTRASRQYLMRAVEIDPSMIEARISLRFLELRDEGLNRLRAYERLAQEFPESPQITIAWAQSLGRAGNWEQAAELLSSNSDAGSAQLAAAAGDAYRALGELNQAVIAYERACRLAPYNVLIRNRLAAALAQAGQPQMALEQVTRVLALDPDNDVARRNLMLLKSASNEGKPAAVQSP